MREAAHGLAFCTCIALASAAGSGCRFWCWSHRHLASRLSTNPENCYHPRSSGLAVLYGTGTNNREVSRESSRDQFGCWRCALRHHVNTGMGDAHEQPRLRSERSHAGPKRALCVQSVRVPVATELLSPLRLRLPVVLRLWTRLLQLWSKLLRLRTKLPVLPLKPLRAGSLNSTGRSPGLAPRTILLTYEADRRHRDFVARLHGSADRRRLGGMDARQRPPLAGSIGKCPRNDDIDAALTHAIVTKHGG